MVNLYPLVIADATLNALISGRFYRRGMAPSTVLAPYVTWHMIDGQHDNQLSGNPCSVRTVFRLSIWADNSAQIETVANALRSFLFGIGYVLNESDGPRDLITMRWQFVFTASVIN